MTSPRFLPKNAQEVQKVILFFIWRGEEYVLTLQFLDSRTGEFFPLKFFFFLNLAIFIRRKKGVKVGPKVQTLGISHFCKNLSFSKTLKALFLFPWVLPVVKILAESGNIWGRKGPEPTQKGTFHGCWIGTKNFENLWLDNQECYTHKTYHDYVSLWEPSFAKKLGRKRRRNGKSSKNEPENQFFGLISWNSQDSIKSRNMPCTSLLVQISKEFDCIYLGE